MKRLPAIVWVASLWVASLWAGTPVWGQSALERGESLLAQERWADAENALREALVADPESAAIRTALARALLSQGEAVDAVQEGYLAVRLDGDSPDARRVYGRALLAAGRPLDAARELEIAAGAAADDAVALEALAEAYVAARDDRAVDAYERLFALGPENGRYHVALAEYLWANGEAGRGNDVMERAIEAFPDDERLHVVFGRALFTQDKPVDAARQLGLARDAGITSLPVMTVLCWALWRSGEPEATEEAFTAALDLYPAAGSLQQDFGRFLLSVGRAEPALAALQEAVRLQPGQANAYLELGRALEAVGRYDEAERAYRRSLELGPQLATPYYTLGRLLMLHGDREEGERLLARYRTIFEQVARREQETRVRTAELSRAQAELRHGDPEKALDLFAALPESVDSLRGQAHALSKLGRHSAAVGLLERAADLQPQNSTVQVELASERARAEAGSKGKAEGEASP